MKNVYGYIRVSTAKQGEGVSLAVQKESITRYAETHNLIITEWFEEKETAAKQGRPLFTTMMKNLKAGKAAGVIIHKIDRSARNLKDWAALGELIDKGVDVHFAHESIDLQARGGRLSADIQAVIAADYIRNLREETLKGIYGRLEQGLYPFQAPIGYVDKGAGKPKEIDPIKGPLIKEAFHLYATNRYSLDDVGDRLYELGLRNLRGGRVSQTGISTILHNPFYIGILRVKGKVYKGAHTPLIAVKTFEKVQKLLAGKMNDKVREHEFLFRKFITCTHCGYSLIGEKQKGHAYYRCHTKTCPTKGYRETYLDMLVKNMLSAIELQPEEHATLTDLVASLDKQWLDAQKDLSRNLRLQAAKKEEELEVLTDAVLDGTIDKEAYNKRKEKLLIQLQTLKLSQDEAERGKGQVIGKVKKFLELAKSLKNQYDSFKITEKRDLVKILTSNRSIKGKKLVFTMKSPFMELANRSILTFGPPSQSTSRKMYTKFAYAGNTSTITLPPLDKKQLQKFLDILVSNFDRLSGVEE